MVNSKMLSANFKQKIVLLSLFFWIALSACAPQKTGSHTQEKAIPKRKSMGTIESIKQDNRWNKLATAQHPQILQAYGGEYKNVQLERMIAKIVGNLTIVDENRKENYRIIILNSPSINAFALPGGYIYITRGLIALANDSSEIAAVLAHEMGHVTANHGLIREKLEAEEKVTEQIASNVLSESQMAKTAAVHGKLRIAQFSRNQELEADAIGIKSIGKAGYDTHGAERFLISMERYKKLQNESTGGFPALDFLSSHPNNPHRIAMARSHAEFFSSTRQGIRDRDTFLKGINGLAFGPSLEEGYLNGNIFIHPRSGFSFQLPDGFTVEEIGQVMNANGPENMAIRFDCIELQEKTSLSDYLNHGLIAGLDKKTIEKTEINGKEAATAKSYTEKWKFDIILIKKNETKACRLLTAAPIEAIEPIEKVAAMLKNSLHFIGQSKKEARFLKIRIVTVKLNDTLSSLADKMTGIEKKEKLFCVLNALSCQEKSLPQGKQIKIITNE